MAGVAGQRGEQLEFARGKIDLFAVDQDFVSRNIDGQLAEFKHFALRFGIHVSAAQKSAHARNQLARRKRLDEVVVGTKLKADDTVSHIALRSQHDDGYVGVVANRTAYVLARNARKHKVQNDQVEMMPTEFFQGFLTVADGGNPIIVTLKKASDSVANGLFVFYK